MLTLYASPGSGNCYKPFLAMRQLCVPFTISAVDLLGGETRSHAYRAINPTGTVPYLSVAGGRGLSESNAMLWFIGAGSTLIPQEPFDRALGLQWMFYEQTKLETFISPARFFTTIAPALGIGREMEIAAWRQKAEIGLAHLDTYLTQTDFIAGSSYSIADIGVFGYVHVSHEAKIAIERFPAIRRWIARVEATPRYLPISELCRTASPPTSMVA